MEGTGVLDLEWVLKAAGRFIAIVMGIDARDGPEVRPCKVEKVGAVPHQITSNLGTVSNVRTKYGCVANA